MSIIWIINININRLIKVVNWLYFFNYLRKNLNIEKKRPRKSNHAVWLTNECGCDTTTFFLPSVYKFSVRNFRRREFPISPKPFSKPPPSYNCPSMMCSMASSSSSFMAFISLANPLAIFSSLTLFIQFNLTNVSYDTHWTSESQRLLLQHSLIYPELYPLFIRSCTPCLSGVVSLVYPELYPPCLSGVVPLVYPELYPLFIRSCIPCF